MRLVGVLLSLCAGLLLLVGLEAATGASAAPLQSSGSPCTHHPIPTARETVSVASPFAPHVVATVVTTTPTSTTTTTTTTTTTVPVNPADASTVSPGGGPGDPDTAATIATVNPACETAADLAFTGTGRGVWITGIAGILLLNAGFLILTIYYRPRQIPGLLRRGVVHILGGR